MLSGRRLDLLNPSPLDIEISDIAHGLARVARWNGQTHGEHAFSVAQHSIVVEGLLERVWPGADAYDRLGALLHDAAEYVVGDMISPFKTALGVDYRRFEDRLSIAIRTRFGLSAEPTTDAHRRLKKADRASAYYEATALAGFSPEEAAHLFGAPPAGPPPDMTPLSPLAAQSAFLDRFERLMADVDALDRKGSPP
jgi:hypothetical protein